MKVILIGYSYRGRGREAECSSLKLVKLAMKVILIGYSYRGRGREAECAYSAKNAMWFMDWVRDDSKYRQ